jgi:hypothetical protein
VTDKDISLYKIASIIFEFTVLADRRDNNSEVIASIKDNIEFDELLFAGIESFDKLNKILLDLHYSMKRIFGYYD